MTSPKTFCAWLLREVWGKPSTIRPSEALKLAEWAEPDELPLDTCLRLTGIERCPAASFTDEAFDYYRTRDQEIIDKEPN